MGHNLAKLQSATHDIKRSTGLTCTCSRVWCLRSYLKINHSLKYAWPFLVCQSALTGKQVVSGRRSLWSREWSWAQPRCHSEGWAHCVNAEAAAEATRVTWGTDRATPSSTCSWYTNRRVEHMGRCSAYVTACLGVMVQVLVCVWTFLWHGYSLTEDLGYVLPSRRHCIRVQCEVAAFILFVQIFSYLRLIRNWLPATPNTLFLCLPFKFSFIQSFMVNWVGLSHYGVTGKSWEIHHGGVCYTC